MSLGFMIMGARVSEPPPMNAPVGRSVHGMGLHFLIRFLTLR
jgi:hypothetical protein